ncbi:MAG: ribonuclease H-like domain-containing protein, partial [Candidatus Obscuribacterales bacterium]|nr:ribonuclease H-like domain-containing protein [Candidatus Obscuribacterales bacterium]
VYHYGAYEISALRRLASRHGTRESILDELLRSKVFVDLYAIVRKGLRIGCESYSIKYVEHLYMEKRQGEVSKATDSIVYYERWLEEPDGKDWQSSQLLKDIRDYNQIDCESTALLCTWLRSKQIENNIKFSESKAEPAQEQKQTNNNAALAERLLCGIPADRSADLEDWRVRELLAHMLGFHNRERKVSWWEIFDRAEWTEEELMADSNCIASVKRTSKAPDEEKRSLLYEYYFDPSQDIKLKQHDNVTFSSDTRIDCEIFSLDLEYGRLQLKRNATKDAPPPEGHLILKESVNNTPLEEAIHRLCSKFAETSKLPSCISDFLFRRVPRLKGSQTIGELISAAKSSAPDSEDEAAFQLRSAILAIENLDNSYICVQGPPGTGKTYLSAKAIVKLIKQGKRIGVSSNSHKAIENLLEAIGIAATEEKLQLSAAKVGQDSSGSSTTFSNRNIELCSPEQALKNLDSYQLIGATAWFFAKQEVCGQFDYLFVDEAGQVCLANILAMGESCKNLVLVGDHLQLDQPVKGSHPGESGKSSLDYLLGEAATISPDFGIFLAISRRMHPKLCALVSSAVYEGRLHSDPLAEKRRLNVGPNQSLLAATSGVLYLPVEHEGNSQSSVEEMQCIEKLLEILLNSEFSNGSETRKMKIDDILIVAPYNRQVRLIKSHIHNAVAASVDKFQGREAPVVIVTMCASDLSNTARGLEFLLSKKRLNVAISRAQVLAIIVGSPALCEFTCSTVEQADLLNFYCRIMQDGLQQNRAVEAFGSNNI